MDVNSHVKSVIKVGFREQINYMKFMKIQWNLSKVNTYGTEVFVRFREVSALERFELKSYQI